MRMRFKSLVGGLLLIVGFVCGCSKPGVQEVATSPDDSGAVSRIHWVGKKTIAKDPMGTNFYSIWSMPESYRVETQTVDRLASAPWRLLQGQDQVTNPACALLRPLIQDLVDCESFVEFRAQTNGFSELALAVRVDEERARVWETNLVQALISLTGADTVLSANKAGWSIKAGNIPDLFEFGRSKGWVVVGMAEGTNRLFGGLLSRVSGGRKLAANTNNWLDADVQVDELMGIFRGGQMSTTNLPRLIVQFMGEGETVHTRVEATFPQPLGIELDDWNVPTNLIAPELLGFTAVRGVRPWLASRKWWNDWQLGVPPNQIFYWSAWGQPMESYMAVPLTDASNFVARAADLLVGPGNAWLKSLHGIGDFWASNAKDEVAWREVPYASPFLRISRNESNDFVVCGMTPLGELTTPPPQVLNQLTNLTNLVCYEWEITDPRIGAGFQISQLVRMASGRSQLAGETASSPWIRGIAPRLGNYVAVTTLPKPNELLMVSRSYIGMTALQLQVLADWLESPQFPVGFYTVLTPPPLHDAGLPVD